MPKIRIFKNTFFGKFIFKIFLLRVAHDWLFIKLCIFLIFLFLSNILLEFWSTFLICPFHKRNHCFFKQIWFFQAKYKYLIEFWTEQEKRKYTCELITYFCRERLNLLCVFFVTYNKFSILLTLSHFVLFL